MTGEPPAIDQIKQIAGLGGSAGLVFFVLRWVANFVTQRLDRRESRLTAEHDALDLGWKAYRQQLEARLGKVERQSWAAFTSFQHVASALIRHDPQDPALLIAEKLMAAAFPADFTMATTMAGAAVDNSGGTSGCN